MKGIHIHYYYMDITLRYRSGATYYTCGWSYLWHIKCVIRHTQRLGPYIIALKIDLILESGL